MQDAVDPYFHTLSVPEEEATPGMRASHAAEDFGEAAMAAMGVPPADTQRFLAGLRDRRRISLEDTTPPRTFAGFRDYAILDENGVPIGRVEIRLQRDGTLFIRSIQIDARRRGGYGKSVYRLLQEMFLDHTVVSDPESMETRSEKDQEYGDAVYVWESLVRDGLAEKFAEKAYGFVRPDKLRENPFANTPKSL